LVTYLWAPVDSIAGDVTNDTIFSRNLFYPRNEFVLTAAKGNCVKTDTVVVYQYSRQIPNFANHTTGDTIAVQGSSLQLLIDPSANFKQYVWTPNLFVESYVPVTTTPYITISPLDINGTGFLIYQVEAMSLPQYGSCKETASIKINITGTPEPYTGFTPNGDGQNDYWLIKNAAFNDKMSIDVFNRWGEAIYSQKGCPAADGTDCQVWNGKRNGKDVPIGTYYYVVNLNDGSKAMTGTITIVR